MLLMLAAATAAIDYRQPEAWLCRPGRQDVCSAEVPAPAKTPAADCFYVYPTTSMDATPNSDMTPGVEERGTVTAQFAAFGTVCRRFAPLYRQVTLPAVRSLFTPTPMTIDRETPYADVRDAWRDYLAHDNHGRPFVLIGHSQGANALKRLVAEEIDGKPVAAQLLSAILPGSNVEVPLGRDVGGDFKALPLCRSDRQTGCILGWASYRDSAPPPANALFGRAAHPGMVAACTNPAALGGGSAPLDAIMGFPWWQGGIARYRPAPEMASLPRFAHVAGMSGECRSAAGTSYLAVHVGEGAVGPLTGTPAIGDTAYPEWGWHVVDVSIVQGDLVRLVARQTAAWRAARR